MTFGRWEMSSKKKQVVVEAFGHSSHGCLMCARPPNMDGTSTSIVYIYICIRMFYRDMCSSQDVLSTCPNSPTTVQR